jgi:hypothetical protein
LSTINFATLTGAVFAGAVVLNIDNIPTDKTIAAVRITFNMALYFNIYVIVNWIYLLIFKLIGSCQNAFC